MTREEYEALPQDWISWKNVALGQMDKVAELQKEVELWKDRWQSADQALDATIRDFNHALSEG